MNKEEDHDSTQNSTEIDLVSSISDTSLDPWEGRVKWKWILFLAGMGFIAPVLAHLGISGVWLVLFFVFIMPIACAFWIANKITDKHFSHGFCIGIIVGLFLILSIGMPVTVILVVGIWFGFWASLVGGFKRKRR